MIQKQYIPYALCCLFFISILVMFPAGALAHYASLTVDNYYPGPGEQITATIGFGHSFPGDGKMRRAAYDHASLISIGPDGNVTPIKVTPSEESGNLPIRILFKEKGIHILVLSLKNFSSKTTKGYKYQPKDELTNVLHSRWSETVSKAMICVGNDQKMSQGAGTNDRFQILPMENPETVPAEGYLPVKVVFDGKPWRGLVHATYQGFSDHSDTFAYTTRTDKEGKAEIKMLKKGLWLIYADHAYPYEDSAKADEYAFKTTLTLQY